MDEPDRDTVVFHLKRPYGSYLPLFFGTAADEPCILPKHILGSLPNINTAPYNLKPVGIGPFRITAWNHGDAVELEANPYYWRGKPRLKRITFKLLPSQETLMNQLQTGETDLWPLAPPSYMKRLKDIAALDVLIQPNFRTTNLDFVYTQPIVGEVRVRQAVRAALDRKRMVATILHGYGSTHDGAVIPLDPPTEHDPIVPFDPARAKALLESAGWRAGSDGIRQKDGAKLVLHAVFGGRHDRAGPNYGSRARFAARRRDRGRIEVRAQCFPRAGGGRRYSVRWKIRAGDVSAHAASRVRRLRFVRLSEHPAAR
jgi:peptide/nickel transport system substrate-binding protein